VLAACDVAASDALQPASAMSALPEIRRMANGRCCGIAVPLDGLSARSTRECHEFAPGNWLVTATGKNPLARASRLAEIFGGTIVRGALR
jgi:hypothetical protein